MQTHKACNHEGQVDLPRDGLKRRNCAGLRGDREDVTIAKRANGHNAELHECAFETVLGRLGRHVKRARHKSL